MNSDWALESVEKINDGRQYKIKVRSSSGEVLTHVVASETVVNEFIHGKKEKLMSQYLTCAFVDFLNRACDIDKNAIKELIEKRVECNSNMADDEHLVIKEENGKTYIGFLGIINGILSSLNNDIVVCKEGEDSVEFVSKSGFDFSKDSLKNDSNIILDDFNKKDHL